MNKLDIADMKRILRYAHDNGQITPDRAYLLLTVIEDELQKTLDADKSPETDMS